MMRMYVPVEPLSRFINQLKKGWDFSRAGGQKIADVMMVSKGINLLAQKDTFKEEIWEWRRQSTEIKTWVVFKNFFHRAHR